LNVYHPKFHVEVESFSALQKFLKNKPDDDKLDWADKDFKSIKNGAIIEYEDGDIILMNYKST
jgi:hypothetical protein